MVRNILLGICLYICSAIGLEKHASEGEMTSDNPWQHQLRVRALIKLDRMLSWAIPYDSRLYALDDKGKEIHFLQGHTVAWRFAREFGYFSTTSPLIGAVTDNKDDLGITQSLLGSLLLSSDALWLEIAAAEILTKVVAYRCLEKGAKVSVPLILKDQKAEMVTYSVDTIFDLWQGMPAYGLVPTEEPQAPSILLYRGSDFSLVSKKSWASILSDLDITGPGWTAFQNARPKIHGWLKERAQSGIKTRVMGFSLGGVLAIYTSIYERDLVAKGSIAFNPPGVSKAVFADWESLPKEAIPSFTIFVNRGDGVSKLGKLILHTYELSIDRELRPIEAHVRLMSGEPQLRVFKVNLEKENQSRFAL